ncbi:MAG: DUF4286 family protein [Sphingobacteriaceae bacterium]
MIIYNITFLVENGERQAWLKWIKSVYIPETMGTGLFHANRILRVLNSPNEGETYCIQYESASLDHYDQYITNYATETQLALQQKFGNKQVSFSSVMEIIEPS